VILATETADQAVSIDPTLLALIPIVTAMLTILSGLAGAGIQGRREHAKWLRDRRLEAFITARVYVGQLEQILSELKDMTGDDGKVVENTEKGVTIERAEVLRDESMALRKRMPEVTVAFDLLGSGVVEDSLNEVLRAIAANDKERTRNAKRDFLVQARSLLGIRAPWRAEVEENSTRAFS